MKFCKSCGAKVGENTKFCKGCGRKIFNEDEKEEKIQVNNVKYEEKEETPRNEQLVVQKEKKKLSKKTIGALIGVGALLLIVLVGGFILFKGNSPMGVVEEFEEYLESGEVSKMKEILTSEGSIEIDDTNVEILIEGLKDAEIEKEYLIKRLKEEAKSTKASNIEINVRNNIFLTKKKDGLKENYYIGIKPAYIKIPEEIEGTSYTLQAGVKVVDVVLTDGKEHIVMPTIYNLEGTLKNEYVETTDTKVISLIEKEREEVKLFDDVNKVTINTNEGEALLVINGKNTKKKLKDTKVLVGLKRGDIIQGIIEKDGKVRMSPKYNIEGTEKIYIEVEPEKVINHLEYNDKVPEVMEAYMKGMEQAVNYNDFGVIKDYLYPGSQIYNEQIRFIKNTYESGIREYYIAHFIDDLNYDDTKKEWTVRINETFDIDNGKGKTSRKIFDNEYKLKVNEDLERLQITYIKVNYKK